MKNVIAFGKALEQGVSSAHWFLLKYFFGFLAVSIEHVILLFACQVLRRILHIMPALS